MGKARAGEVQMRGIRMCDRREQAALRIGILQVDLAAEPLGVDNNLQ